MTCMDVIIGTRNALNSTDRLATTAIVANELLLQ
jgi:hypothetical protein